MGSHKLLGAFILLVTGHVLASYVDPKRLDACPGYKLSNISERADGMSGTLVLKDNACNVFGDDIKELLLNVLYETREFPFSYLILPRFTVPKPPESMSRLLTRHLLDMKFQRRFCQSQSQRKILPPIMSLALITLPIHFLSPSFAFQPRKSSFRSILQLSSKINIFASKAASLPMLIFMALESILIPSASPRITPPLLSGLATRMAYLQGRICTGPTQSTLSTV